jgi:hypothetical protein
LGLRPLTGFRKKTAFAREQATIIANGVKQSNPFGTYLRFFHSQISLLLIGPLLRRNNKLLLFIPVECGGKHQGQLCLPVTKVTEALLRRRLK